MTRALVLLALLALAAAGVGFIADRPGRIAYEWQGLSGTLSVMQALALLGATVGVIVILLEIARAVFNAPRRMAQRARERRRQRAMAALSDGLVAVAAGDLGTATRAARDAERAAPDAPLTALLCAQAAQLAGDRAGAERRFADMTRSPRTRLLGLRGLSVEAARAGDTARSRAHALTAHQADPSLHWAASAAFHAATAERDFGGALALNDEALRRRLIDRQVWKRRKAVLLTALAATAEDTQTARRLSLEAHGLAKDLVPAAVRAARLVAPQSGRRAAAILEATYRLSPHPDLFAAALDLADGQSAAERLRRAEGFAALRPEHIESALGLAAAARAAGELDAARNALRPFVLDRPSQRVSTLMAEIEAAADAGEGVVREWLARAVRAPQDPAWIADGYRAAEWDAVSPITGELDRYVWSLPAGAAIAPVSAVDLTPPQRALPGPDGTLPRASVPRAS